MRYIAVRTIAISFLFASWFLYSISPILMFGALLIAWGFWRVPKFDSDTIEAKNKKVGFIIILILLSMTMFSYLMVPLFHKMCRSLDIGGKVHAYTGQGKLEQGAVSNIEAYPVVTLYAGVPITIDLAPKVKRLPTSGDFQHLFVLTNKLNNKLAVRLKLTIAPSSATNFIQEISKFNNNVIEFSAKEKKHLLVKYHVINLPKNIAPSIAMAYTFFKKK